MAVGHIRSFQASSIRGQFHFRIVSRIVSQHQQEASRIRAFFSKAVLHRGMFLKGRRLSRRPRRRSRHRGRRRRRRHRRRRRCSRSRSRSRRAAAAVVAAEISAATAAGAGAGAVRDIASGFKIHNCLRFIASAWIGGA